MSDTVGERVALLQAINRASDVDALKRALSQAVAFIESYDMDINGAEESIGIDLVAKGFCQGSIYTSKYRSLTALLNDGESV